MKMSDKMKRTAMNILFDYVLYMCMSVRLLMLVFVYCVMFKFW